MECCSTRCMAHTRNLNRCSDRPKRADREVKAPRTRGSGEAVWRWSGVCLLVVLFAACIWIEMSTPTSSSTSSERAHVKRASVLCSPITPRNIAWPQRGAGGGALGGLWSLRSAVVMPCQKPMSREECRQCRDVAMRSDPTIMELLRQIRATPCGVSVELLNITCSQSSPMAPMSSYASTFCNPPTAPKVQLYADQFCAADCGALTAKLANELTNALDCCASGIDLGNPTDCDECFMWGCSEYRRCRMEGREAPDCWNEFFRSYYPARPNACVGCGTLPAQLFSRCGDPRDGAPGLPPIYAPPY